MNLQTIETVVRRLFDDVEFRSRAMTDPSAALAEYHLATEERVALAKLCARLDDGPQIDPDRSNMWY